MVRNRDVDFKIEMRVGCEDFGAISIKMVVETVTHKGGPRENVESDENRSVTQFWETLTTTGWVRRRADFGRQQILLSQIPEKYVFLDSGRGDLTQKPGPALLTWADLFSLLGVHFQLARIHDELGRSLTLTKISRKYLKCAC